MSVPKGSIKLLMSVPDALLLVKVLRACANVTIATEPKVKMRDMASLIESAVYLRTADKRERARIRQKDWRRRQRAIREALGEQLNGSHPITQ